MSELKLRPRKDAYSPRSGNWTLYNPEDVAQKLTLPVPLVDKVLEETGFNKAVRIREEVIRWKTRLLAEQKELSRQEQELRAQLKKVTLRQKETDEMLINIRNILRMPREKEVSP
jgi:hypothetical protein